MKNEKNEIYPHNAHYPVIFKLFGPCYQTDDHKNIRNSNVVNRAIQITEFSVFNRFRGDFNHLSLNFSAIFLIN